MKKIKWTALALAVVMTMSLAMAPAALAAEDGAVTVFCDGTAGYKLAPEARDADYDGAFFFPQYFGDDVTAGVKALVEAGGVTVNGFAVPTEENGGYTMNVNGSDKLAGSGEMNESNVADAAVSAIGNLLKAAGTQVTLTVTGGQVEKMEIFNTAGILVDHVEEKDGAVLAYTDKDTVFTVSGGASGEPSGEPEAVEFAPENVTDVTDGCIAVYWEAPDGWHLQGAAPIKGYLTDGADHQYYVLEDEDGNTMEYVDAEMYARGFSEGSRPGQFTNTQMNFELSDIEITVWFIPGTEDSDNPMPIGITGLENASVRLERAIAYTQDVLDRTVVAETEEDAAALAADQGIGEDFHWVTEAVTADHMSETTGNDSPGILDMLSGKLAEAQAMLDAGEASPADYDQEAYELFIAMWGSSSDIGAVFSGTVAEGFYDVADAGAHALPAAVLK